MIIKSFSIIDLEKREAQSFIFENKTNLIVSKSNSQGKSSLLKSMYYTLGFDVKQFPSGWNINDLYFQLEVRINGSDYTIDRQKNIYRVSDHEGILNVKEYSFWLSDKLNINMKLANTHTKSLDDVYASALILPFYIDQDDSWDGIIYKGVTDTLGQYLNIPKDIFDNVFSLSNTEITDLKNDLNNYTKEKNKIESTISSFLELVEEYKEENIEQASVSKIDKNLLRKDIERYLNMINNFNEKTTKFKVKLLTKQETLDFQKQELAELEQLLKMNKKRYKSIKTECNYCHSQLTTEQALTRLDLSNNELEIGLLKDEVEKEIQKLTYEIKEFRSEQSEIESKIDSITEKIQKSKRLLTIDDYVQVTAKNEAINEMENLIDKQKLSKQNLEEKIKKLRKQIAVLTSQKKELRTSIKKDYDLSISNIKNVLTGINMNELEFLQFKKIKGSGMDKNKKFLAYYLVYFELLKQYSCYNIPFCIDSFIKNEIAGDNAIEMFGAIEKFFFTENKQSFFSIVSDNIKHLKFKEDYNEVLVEGKLLSKDMYEEISAKITLD